MQPTNKPINPKIQSFLESLRQRSQTSQPNTETTRSRFPVYENYQEKLRLEQLRKQEFFRSRSREFNEVYSLTKRQEQERINQIIIELHSLAKSIKNIKKEVDIAVQQTPIEVNQYQFSFLEHLKQTLQLLREDVESASSWLHLFNSRRQQQSFYWSMAKSKGTKFTLSEERSVSTSIG
jgi:hypothetical protein